jgi:hypothetical protein
VAEYRVTALIYRFASEIEEDRFSRAAPQTGTLGDFHYTLEDAVLRAEPQVEFRDRGVARDELDPYLRSWEQAAFLSPAAHRIRFEYERSEVEDADPQPGVTNLFPDTIYARGVVMDATIVRDNGRYPGPASGFVATPVTARLIGRLRRLHKDGSDLLATAYVVLTTMEKEFGSGDRRTAARMLNVDHQVLHRLGLLTSRADPVRGRKGKGDATPFTADEVTWMREVSVALVRRSGESAAGGPLRPISMGDFPNLP